MQLVLFDDAYIDNLYPFTFTRPAGDIRIGILTIREKWEKLLGLTSSTLTRHYLKGKFPMAAGNPVLMVNGALLPDENFVQAAKSLKSGEQVVHNDKLLMALFEDENSVSIKPSSKLKSVSIGHDPSMVNYPWDIFTMNDKELRSDYKLLTGGKKSDSYAKGNTVSGNDLYIEEGAVVSHSIINTETGPVYIAAGAEVMEGCLIRGPFSLGNGGVLKMGSRVYGATTIGPGAKAGGEISNSVIFGNSNKAHDGFLGNSVIGEWCNLGADTNNSNLKNNYGEVSVWNYKAGDYIKTGLQFCGLFMGDHSKCGINTMFNTGTVVGVSANVFGAGFPQKHIPSFQWGGFGENELFLIDKAHELARRVYKRRGMEFNTIDEEILSHLYLMSLKPKSEEEL